MAYSKGHKAKTRQKILNAANRLFAAQGYESTSIEQIMRECGLTRGGFYSHFSSKGQLYREALGHNPTIDTVLKEPLVTSEPVSAELLPQFAFLATDLANKTPEVRATCSDVLALMNDRILRHSSTHTSETRRLSAAALIVGALAVAHITDDSKLREKLLAACWEDAGILLRGNDRPTPIFFWEPAAA